MSTTGEMPIADMVPTEAEIRQLLVDRPPCWPWALFVSVVYQRMVAVNARPEQPCTRLDTDREVALFVRMRLRDCDELIRACDRFMRAPEFMGVFGYEDEADAEGIVTVANRLMAYYERHRELAQECSDCIAPQRHDELLRECTEFLVVPMRDFGAFMKGVLTRFEEMRQRAMAGDDDIVLRPVLMRTTTDEQLAWSILDRLNDMA